MSLAPRPLATAAVSLLLAATACVKSPPSNPESGAPGANQASHFSAPDTLECVLRIALTALATRVHRIADVSFEDRMKCDAVRGIPLLRAFALSYLS
jgi:hypothetical protein